MAATRGHGIAAPAPFASNDAGAVGAAGAVTAKRAPAGSATLLMVLGTALLAAALDAPGSLGPSSQAAAQLTCGEHARVLGGACVCEEGWGGEGCETPLTPLLWARAVLGWGG